MFPNNFYNNNMFYHPYYPNFPMPVAEEGRSESPSSASDNAGPSSTSTSKQSTSNGSTRWTSEQTATLVALWKENHEKLESAENKTTWDKIVLEVKQFPEKKTLKQCKDKIRNLKQQYKDAKHQNKQTGNSPTTSAFYEDFDEVLGNRPVITMPGVKRFGQSTSTGNCSDQAARDQSDTNHGLQGQPQSGGKGDSTGNCSDQAAGDQSDSNHGLQGQPQGGGKGNCGSKDKGPSKRSPPKKSPLKKSPSKR